MKPKTTQDISWMMRGYLPAAVLGTALELGLFWHLGKTPQSAPQVANSFNIPLKRCQHLLGYLQEMGLLDKTGDSYYPSEIASEAIIEARSQDTWGLLAEEARERMPVLQDLTLHIHERGSIWETQRIILPDYVAKLGSSMDEARRFTRMLYELHQSEAEELAESLDMSGVDKLMDVGGGSGVMSLALLRRYPQLEVLVVDQTNVCVAGREIAIENDLQERISFHPANFLEDELHEDFDLIMECDVGIYNEHLFYKFWSSLNPGGRLVILDYSFETEAADKMQLAGRRFYQSLENPNFEFETTDELKAMLANVGFKSFSKDYPISSGLYFESWK
jgi:ubiquinone/menaquinone biosynthesis C-methylase UbiE